MDFWNRKKVADLEEENCRLIRERNDALSRVAELQKRISGERVCGGYCQVCKYGFPSQVPQYVGAGWYNPWMCILDCKCKEFEQKGL